MKTFWLSAAMTLMMVSPAAVALQETKVDDAVAKERAEKQKRLQEINQVQDDGQRRELLEKFIQENTDRIILEPAYTSLLRTLRNADPNKTIEVADQILAKKFPPRNTLRKNAYIYKLAAYQKQKNEEAINAVGLRILKTETDPVLLHEAADIYKAGAAKLYEKAVAEKQKLKEPDLYPSLGHLYVDLAKELSRLGQKDRALENMARATELIQKQVADLEALPEKDPRRRGLENLREELGDSYHSMARILADAKQAGKGLDYLAKAEGLLDPGAIDELSAIEETRGSLYEKMGNIEKSLDSYVRSIAFGMNPKTMERIKSLAAKTGKPGSAYLADARKLRESAAELFKPFELKTVEGDTRSFQNLRNKVTLVNLFFPTCVPCNTELPHLQKLYDKYKNQGFSMIAINTINYQKELIPDWRTKNKFTFPILVGATDAFLKENYNHQGTPTNMLVNADGKVLFRHVGYDAGAEKVIEAEIREMLGLEPFEASPGEEEKASKQD